MIHTAKHPLSLDRVAPVIFALTELALVDFDGLVRTVDLLKAALQIRQHGLSAELAPISDRFRTELMLLLDNVDRNAAHVVVCEGQRVLHDKHKV